VYDQANGLERHLPMRLSLLLWLSAVVALAFGVSGAEAKGSSAIVAATVEGGELTLPVTTPIALPANLDDMFELAPPADADPAVLPFHLTLHYDFGAEYGGKHDRVGHYDGAFTMHFPQAMVVNGNEWAPGWYTAVDELAFPLGLAASGQTTGAPASDLAVAGEGRPASGDSASVTALALLVAGFLAVVAGRARAIRRTSSPPRDR
jgi:hypothetical protein